MKHARAVATFAAASAVLLALAAPAAAAPPDIEHWTDRIDQIEQEEIEGWCVDEEGDAMVPFPVRYVEDSWGTFRGVMRRGEFYGASSVHVEASWTNTTNGKSFSFVHNGQDKDQFVTTNPDGTVTIDILTTGPTQYYGPDGERLFKDVGRTFVTIVLDENGDFIEAYDADLKGRYDTMNRDFCADILEIIG